MRGGFAGRDVDLEAVLAGVAGARDARRRAGDFAVGEPVVADARQVDRRQLLQRRQRRGPCTAICA